MVGTIRVIKKPLTHPFRNRPQAFPHVKMLYLELLENKQKIKPHLVNKEFIPKEPSGGMDLAVNGGDAPEIPEMDSPKYQDSPRLESPKLDKPPDGSFVEDRLKKLLASSRNPAVQSSRTRTRSSALHRPTHQPRDQPPSDDIKKPTEDAKPKDDENKPPEKASDQQPPKLSDIKNEINDGKKQGIQDLTFTTPDDEEKSKLDLLFKFDILRKQYKGATIPEFTIHSDYQTMKRTYETTIKSVSLDAAVDNYKTYLVAGFAFVEYVFGHWFGDIQGFTQQQLTSMASYERLLIELGEKSYVSSKSSWPVEIRLLGLILFNAALFILTKVIFKRTGLATHVPATKPPKKKMKGPSLSLDD